MITLRKINTIQLKCQLLVHDNEQMSTFIREKDCFEHARRDQRKQNNSKQ